MIVVKAALWIMRVLAQLLWRGDLRDPSAQALRELRERQEQEKEERRQRMLRRWAEDQEGRKHEQDERGGHDDT